MSRSRGVVLLESKVAQVACPACPGVSLVAVVLDVAGLLSLRVHGARVAVHLGVARLGQPASHMPNASCRQGCWVFGAGVAGGGGGPHDRCRGPASSRAGALRAVALEPVTKPWRPAQLGCKVERLCDARIMQIKCMPSCMEFTFFASSTPTQRTRAHMLCMMYDIQAAVCPVSRSTHVVTVLGSPGTAPGRFLPTLPTCVCHATTAPHSHSQRSLLLQ